MLLNPVRRRGFTLAELLVVLALVLVLLGLIVPATMKVRAAAARAQCAGNLYQLTVGFCSFRETHGAFPTRGGDAGNWLAQVQPFLAPDAPPEGVIAALQCPAHPFAHSRSETPRRGLTFYAAPIERSRLIARMATTTPTPDGFIVTVVTTGDSAVIAHPVRTVIEVKRDPFHLCSRHAPGVTLARITDGTSVTVLVVERPPAPDRSLGWWAQAGEDSETTVFRTAPLVFATDATTGRPCPNPAVFGPGGVDDMCSFNSTWSAHRGGANFLFADGHVAFQTYAVAARPSGLDKSILEAQVSRAGNEAILEP